jgi:hypothetical protein
MLNQEVSDRGPTKDKPFYCKDCYCGFNKLHHYNFHLDSNKHKNRISKENTNFHICSICQKNFSHSSSLYRHRAKCKKMEVKETPNIDILQKENEELRKEIELLKKNQNNNTTNIQTQNIINIKCFGNENMEYITDKVILQCIGKVYGSIPMIIERIHFDPEHPENHNIKIPNKKLPHANVMTENDSWKLVKLDDAIDSMIDTGYNLLDETFQEKGHVLSNNQQKHFKNFQSKYEDGDKKTIKDIKETVELLVINKTR